MDEQFELNGISFVWNREKVEVNLGKHDVACSEVAEAFFDPFLRVVDASSDQEARDAVIGMDERWNLLFVVHVAFEHDSVRLISARRATRNDRRLYED